MSKICLGVLTDNNMDLEQVRHQVKELIEPFGLAVFFEQTYNEPLLEAFIDKRCIVFSVADSYQHDNCEMFLLPDECTFNGRNNNTSFSIRMEKLGVIVGKLLGCSEEVHLFIGDSGTRYSEFETHSISILEFQRIIGQLNTVTPEDLHIIVTNRLST